MIGIRERYPNAGQLESAMQTQGALERLTEELQAAVRERRSMLLGGEEGAPEWHAVILEPIAELADAVAGSARAAKALHEWQGAPTERC